MLSCDKMETNRGGGLHAGMVETAFNTRDAWDLRSWTDFYQIWVPNSSRAVELCKYRKPEALRVVGM